MNRFHPSRSSGLTLIVWTFTMRLSDFNHATPEDGVPLNESLRE
jgi:hypothetical protein